MTELDHLKLSINSIRPFLVKGSIDQRAVEILKLKLDELIPFFSSPIFKIGFPEIQRVTINRMLFDNFNKRIEYINLLKYPPANLVKKYGRANNVGQSILYATFDPITALNEMKPNVGDLITISTWALPDDINLSVTPIITSLPKENFYLNERSIYFSIGYLNSLPRYPKEVAEQIDELIKFVAECFTKDVDYGNNYDYFLSAYFANKIFNKLDNGNVEAIVYPSVPEKLGSSNIALKPEAFDNKYKLIKVNESIVMATPTIYNKWGYSLRETGRANNFNLKKNKIIWK